MSVVAAAIGGTALLGAYSSSKASKAAGKASGAQTDAALAGIDAQERQMEALRELLLPYVQAGSGIAYDPGGKFDTDAYLAAHPEVAAHPYYRDNAEEHYENFGKSYGFERPVTAATPGRPGALQGQQDLIGLNGAAAQQASIDALRMSPMFTSMLKQGENSILQNASATGGLRGGNVQAALAEFSPALLAATINDQYSKLGGLVTVGQNAAAGVGTSGSQGTSAITQLLGQIGSAQAGGALGQASAASGLAGGLSSGLGLYAGLQGRGAVSSGYTLPSGLLNFSGANISGTGTGLTGF